MLRGRLFPLLFLVLGACVSFSPTPRYQKNESGSNGWTVRLESQPMGGSADRPLSYEVIWQYHSFLNGPGGGTKRDRIEVYAFYRCAELAVELGKPYFIMKDFPNGLLDPNREFEPDKIDYGSSYFTELVIQHSIAVFATREEALAARKRYQYPQVFDARKILERYGPWIQR